MGVQEECDLCREKKLQKKNMICYTVQRQTVRGRKEEREKEREGGSEWGVETIIYTQIGT